MRKRIEVILASLLILLCVGLRMAYTGSVAQRDGGADLIKLDALTPFGALERPAVYFPHEKHASNGDEASCLTCHDPESGEDAGLVFTFKSQDGLSKDELKDLYHTQCLSCHADLESAHQPSGPQVCGGCHVNEAPATEVPSHALEFDESLHTLHTETAAIDCQSCHDLLDSTEEDAPSASLYENSSHDLCVSCHLAEATPEAPLDCSGCHLSSLTPSMAMPASTEGPRGGEVLFDHDLHEAADVSCEVCHHKEPDTQCSECHTDGDSIKSGGVTLQTAMHTRSAEGSCVGCHEEMGIGTLDECASCHTPFGNGRS